MHPRVDVQKSLLSCYINKNVAKKGYNKIIFYLSFLYSVLLRA
jgi:hypothetical protein